MALSPKASTFFNLGVVLADTANRRVATYLAQRFDVVGQQQWRSP